MILPIAIEETREDRRGRPRSMPSSKRGMNYSIYLDLEQVEILNDFRLQNDTSISKEIRKAVELYIIKNTTKNDSTLDKWQEDPDYKIIPSLLDDKKKWQKYIQEMVDNKELLKITEQINFIKEEINNRRRKEYLEQQKQNNPIYKYYKKQGKV